MDDVRIDGNATLEEQEDTLRVQEDLGFAIVTQYNKDGTPGLKANVAKFADAVGAQKQLRLFKIAAPVTVASVLAANPGATVVFESVVYVSGNDANVMGIR